MKGGALLYAFEREKSRPTLDIDLLGMQIKNDEHTLNTFYEICSMPYPNDGVAFNLDTLTTYEIAKEGNYSGIRIKVEATLGNMRQSMQVDIGFGDVITPAPIRMEYPTLLPIDSPEVQAYSVETVIAEKFEAMIDLAEINSRMKDFYDLYRLLGGDTYKPKVLVEAIRNTFVRRGTTYREPHPLFTNTFASDDNRNRQWKVFLRKSYLDQTIPFPEVMQLITSKLLPIYEQLKG